jgi:hypothetical protein
MFAFFSFSFFSIFFSKKVKKILWGGQNKIYKLKINLLKNKN